jgi:hypothetical protein
MPPAEAWRWFLAGWAVVLAALIGVYLYLFLLFFSAFPKSLSAPTGAFAACLLVVLAGALIAPRYRVRTAIVLAVLATASGIIFLGLPPLAGMMGGLTAIAFVVSRTRLECRRSARLFLGAVLIAGVAFLGLVRARYVDMPARPDPLPLPLERALGPLAKEVTFYAYELGGFMDSTSLWRIDAKAEAVQLVIDGFGLKPIVAVPGQFWRMPPSYWPRSLPAGAKAFQSHFFTADTRGGDGSHYFLLHDVAQNRAFVWVKDNF